MQSYSAQYNAVESDDNKYTNILFPWLIRVILYRHFSYS